jgi:phosphate butyryltransferase
MRTAAVVNRTYGEIRVGDTAEITRVLTPDELLLFAHASGNLNPIHLPKAGDVAAGDGRAVAPSMWVTALFSSALGMKLPGPGTLYRSQTTTFHDRVHVNEAVTVSVRVLAKEGDCIVRLATRAVREDGTLVAEGEATVIAPVERRVMQAGELPDILIERHLHFDRLIAEAQKLPWLDTAVVAAGEAKSLRGALMAKEHGLIKPVLVGSTGEINAAAEEIGATLDGIEIVEAENDHEAAGYAVELVCQGRARALMKGHLHSDVLLSAVVKKEAGLRGGRRLTHVFVMDVPGLPRPLLISDAAINIAPTLEMKIDIIDNAIALAHAIGIGLPRVGVLSAVETVNPAIPSTIDAAVLSKMAERGQIRGGIVDGPLAMDNAIDLDAARTKGIKSLVAGQADILIVPNLEAGNMLAKELTFMAHAEAAGLVMGAKVPVILTSRADSERSRLASAALAVLTHHWQHHGAAMPVAIAAE